HASRLPRAVAQVRRPHGLRTRFHSDARAVAGLRECGTGTVNGHREYDPPRHFVVDAVRRAIADDVGPLGDLSAALLPHDERAVADFIPRAPGVLAGTSCASETFAQLDPSVRVTWAEADGATVERGQSIGRLEGPLRSILTGERTALNFL